MCDIWGRVGVDFLKCFGHLCKGFIFIFIFHVEGYYFCLIVNVRKWGDVRGGWYYY